MSNAALADVSVMPAPPDTPPWRATRRPAAACVRHAGTLAHAALLRNGGVTRAVPGFEATPFRVAGDEIIWVGSDGPEHPRTVLIDAVAAYGVLAISSATTISFCNAAETLGGCAFSISRARTTASRAILRLIGISTPRGFASMLLGQSPPFPLSHRADAARALAQACVSDDASAFVHHAQRMLGVGSGLTPSGDDFVGGALFALRLIHVRHAAPDVNVAADAAPEVTGSASDSADPSGAPASRWQRAAAHIVGHAASRTHVISAALLSDLARGQSYAALHGFAAAIAHGDAEAAFTHAAALTSIGASSGWDMLAGFMAALRGSAGQITPAPTLPHVSGTPHATTHGTHRHV